MTRICLAYDGSVNASVYPTIPVWKTASPLVDLSAPKAYPSHIDPSFSTKADFRAAIADSREISRASFYNKNIRNYNLAAAMPMVKQLLFREGRFFAFLLVVGRAISLHVEILPTTLSTEMQRCLCSDLSCQMFSKLLRSLRHVQTDCQRLRGGHGDGCGCGDAGDVSKRQCCIF